MLGTTLRAFTIALSLVALGGCASEVVDDDAADDDVTEETAKPDQAVMKVRPQIKNAIGNVR